MSIFLNKVLRLTIMCGVLSFGQSLPSYAQSPEAIEVKVGVKGQEKIQKIVPGSGQSFRDADYAPEMVVVPAGKFMMGSPATEVGWSDNEGPQREVTIGKAFVVGKYEVTFAEWDACVADDGCNGYKPSDEGGGRERQPVINVSWNDAQAYVKWLSEKTGQSYRLLTEAEWEYAARAGTQTRYSFGDDEKDMGDYGWYSDNSGIKAHQVGGKKPNPFGLYDLHGNLWEWVEDVRHWNYKGAPQDGSAWISDPGPRVVLGKSWYCPTCTTHYVQLQRVLRGGSYAHNPADLRSARRISFSVDDRGRTQGFRIARSASGD